MARLPRFALLGQSQHVLQRGNNRTAIFLTPVDHALFLRWLGEGCLRYGCLVHAYVLMTNHVHLLMTPEAEGAIGKTMQSVGRKFVRHFNDVHERTGTLWEGRYRAIPVERERYLFNCYRYIELNPVRAGIAAAPEDYPWSSYRANAFGDHDALVTPHMLYSGLGSDHLSRGTAYRSLFAETLNHSVVAEIRKATNQGWPLGSDRFRSGIAASTGRRSHPLSAGGARAGAGRPRSVARVQVAQPSRIESMKINGV